MPLRFCRLSTYGADTTALKDDHPFLAIDTHDSTNITIHFVDTTSNIHNPLDAVHVSYDKPNGTVDIPVMPTAFGFLREQAKATDCRAITSHIGKPSAEFQAVQHGLLVLRSTADTAIPIVVPALLLQRIIILALKPPMAGTFMQCKMYNTLKCKLF